MIKMSSGVIYEGPPPGPTSCRSYRSFETERGWFWLQCELGDGHPGTGRHSKHRHGGEQWGK